MRGLRFSRFSIFSGSQGSQQYQDAAAVINHVQPGLPRQLAGRRILRPWLEPDVPHPGSNGLRDYLPRNLWRSNDRQGLGHPGQFRKRRVCGVLLYESARRVDGQRRPAGFEQRPEHAIAILAAVAGSARHGKRCGPEKIGYGGGRLCRHDIAVQK